MLIVKTLAYKQDLPGAIGFTQRLYEKLLKELVAWHWLNDIICKILSELMNHLESRLRLYQRSGLLEMLHS